MCVFVSVSVQAWRHILTSATFMHADNAKKCAVAVEHIIDGLSGVKTGHDYIGELGLAALPNDSKAGYAWSSSSGELWIKKPCDRARNRMDRTRAVQQNAIRRLQDGLSSSQLTQKRRLAGSGRIPDEGTGTLVQLS